MQTSNTNKSRKGMALFFTLPIFSWALYDFANTIFSSNINTIFFPLYLQAKVGGDPVLDQLASSFISYLNAIASIFLVIFSPLYGVYMDRSGKKKFLLVVFALFSILATIFMGVFEFWQTSATIFNLSLSFILVIFLFVVAKFFYNSSLVFYDAMISDLGNKQEIPLISGFGVAIGYLGTLVGLSVYPFAGDEQYALAFLLSGLLFLIFSLPIFFLYKEKEKPNPAPQKSTSFFKGYRDIFQTFKEMKAYKPIFTFMIAYFFFNDALQTAIAMMAVYSKIVLGFSTGQFILLYLVSTVSSIIGSFVFGYITKRVGAKKAVNQVAIIMIIAIVMAAITTSTGLFWVAGSLFGIALGSMWVTSRTLIVELTPVEKRGEFFGLFAFSGKVSAIVGPVIYGSITLLFAASGTLASRFAIGSLAVMVLIGLLFHIRIKDLTVKN